MIRVGRGFSNQLAMRIGCNCFYLAVKRSMSLHFVTFFQDKAEIRRFDQSPGKSEVASNGSG